MLQQLKAMRNDRACRTEPDVARPMAVAQDPPTVSPSSTISGIAGPKAGGHTEMNRPDPEAQVLATRNAKEYADFAMFTMHVHANRWLSGLFPGSLSRQLSQRV